MESSHKSKVSKKFKDQLKGKRLICLAIPDNYARMDPALVRLLEIKATQCLSAVVAHCPPLSKGAEDS